jgi:hypothetical protein
VCPRYDLYKLLGAVVKEVIARAAAAVVLPVVVLCASCAQPTRNVTADQQRLAAAPASGTISDSADPSYYPSSLEGAPLIEPSDVTVPPPPPFPATKSPPPEFPSGPEQLLPIWRDIAEVEKQMAEEGWTWADFAALQTIRVDVPAEWNFAPVDFIIDSPKPLQFSSALVPVDNIVIVEFTGDTCTRAVGGYAYVADTGPVVVLYGGQIFKQESGDPLTCFESVEYQRLVLHVDGAKARSTVTGPGGPVESQEILLPMLEDLPKIILSNADLPWYVGE